MSVDNPVTHHARRSKAELDRERAEVKLLLQSAILALCQHLLPDGEQHGKYWLARNPARNDKNAGSFWVSLRGVPGSWRDEATGEKGDVFGLIELKSGYGDFAEVMKWAKTWTGYAHVSPAEFKARRRQLVADADRERAAEEARLLDRRGYAQHLWLRANPHLTGTLVAKYLKTRGLDLDLLDRVPRAIRADSWHWHSDMRQKFPCMMVMMTGPDNKFWALHRTWIARDGSGKADVTPARKIMPRFKGAAMRLSRGESGLNPTEAARRGVRGPLVICEGVEDGLSIMLARPDLRVWAVGALGNVGAIELPDCVSDVVVAADNDWGKPQAEKLLRQGLAALAAQGRPVRVARSPIGKDFNDAVRDNG